MKRNVFVLAIMLVASGLHAAQPYTIVGTGQNRCYDNFKHITPPPSGKPFFGQDAQHPRADAELQRQRRWHGQRFEHRIDVGAGSWPHAGVGCRSCWCRKLPRRRLQRLADADDQGTLLAHQLQRRDSAPARTTSSLTPYHRHEVFQVRLRRRVAPANAPLIARIGAHQSMSAQRWAATRLFGVNFADGRIKGYPAATIPAAGDKTFVAICVRGNPNYGKNDFHDNGDGTITDRATGLMWSKADSGKGMNWEAALAWVQARNAKKYLGHSDWRLPNAKELQSIVDYTPRAGGNAIRRHLSALPSHQAPRRRVSVFLVQHDAPGRPS